MNNKGVYPVNKDQRDKFYVGVIKVIHSTPAFSDALSDKSAPVAVKIGTLASKVLADMVMRVIQQTGLKIGRNFLVEAIKVVVSELSTIAAAMGQKPTREEMAQAIRLAGDTLEQTMAGMQKGQGQQQGQTEQQQPVQQVQQPMQQSVQQQSGQGLAQGGM